MTRKVFNYFEGVALNTVEAVRHMLSTSGLTVRAAGAALHRAPTYLSNILTRGSTPRADVLARVASVCGYSLVLIPSNEQAPRGSLVIDATTEDTPQEDKPTE